MIVSLKILVVIVLRLINIKKGSIVGELALMENGRMKCLLLGSSTDSVCDWGNKNAVSLIIIHT